MNYEQMTDFEINKAVAKVLGYECMQGQKNATTLMVNKSTDGSYCNEFFDPCTNVSDAWPIIAQNRINIGWSADNMAYSKLGDTRCYEDKGCITWHKNPFRAAMIVFLKSKDDQRSKVRI